MSAVEEGTLGPQRNGDPMLVAITFDDGPIFDIEDFTHPMFGPQRGFVRIMQDFRATPAGRTQADLRATSFVIASPQARQIMETTGFDPEYTYLGPGSMGDGPGGIARSTPELISASPPTAGIICIPACPEVAHSAQARADFHAGANPGRWRTARSANHFHLHRGAHARPQPAFSLIPSGTITTTCRTTTCRRPDRRASDGARGVHRGAAKALGGRKPVASPAVCLRSPLDRVDELRAILGSGSA